MTEYELRDAASAYFAQSTTDSTKVFTLVTAYLVVAYLVGAKLPKNQLITISSLYGAWVTMAIWAVMASLDQAAQVYQRSIESGYSWVSDQDLNEIVFFTWAFPLILLSGVFASFYFMWAVRKSKE